ncbi:hypothetical protein CLV92_105169 [Kineococcus xinjiangensis]|uniref:Uncharacterized protein n=1 Tax=Kineococcus xinjiangensis TaxID=512762 RepID=A0A2S6IPD7_9ACTN|nr:HGxxPAAW family protein [Kineococcus xinjiangensis]PPK96068.1 hypothetical protein CLV92_105169 [Kineococcus xinjiangensis]
MEQSGGTAGRPVTPAQASRNAQPDGPAEVVDEHGHGSTPAAWSAVGLALLGGLIASLAVVFVNIPMGIVGGVMMLLAPVLGMVLSKMGYGAKGAHGGAAGAHRPGAS